MEFCDKDVCYIITWYSSVREIISVRGVNHHWNMVSRNSLAWKSSKLIHECSKPYLDCYQLDERQIMLGLEFVEATSKMKNLQSLIVYYLPLQPMLLCQVRIHVVSLRLRSVNMDSRHKLWAEQLSSVFPDLTELSTSLITGYSTTTLVSLSKTFPAIKILELDFALGNEMITEQTGQALSKFPHLTDLSVGYYSTRSRCGFLCIQGLKRLELKHDLDEYDCFALVPAVSNCKTLDSLSITSSLMNSKTFTGLLSGLASQLRFLHIVLSTEFARFNELNDLLSGLGTFHNLIELSISLYATSTPIPVNDLLVCLKQLSNLQRFELCSKRFAVNTQDDENLLKEMSKKCQTLKYFRWNNRIQVF